MPLGSSPALQWASIHLRLTLQTRRPKAYNFAETGATPQTPNEVRRWRRNAHQNAQTKPIAKHAALKSPIPFTITGALPHGGGLLFQLARGAGSEHQRSRRRSSSGRERTSTSSGALPSAGVAGALLLAHGSASTRLVLLRVALVVVECMFRLIPQRMERRRPLFVVVPEKKVKS